jgi:AcrR family transcriptional regulator
VADIIARAGVSRTTFYQLYKDKEDCFLSCFEPLAQSHLALVESALAAPGPHAERLLRGLQAYLSRLDADRAFARAFIGEAESATPAIRAAYQRARARNAATLRRWLDAARRDHPEVPACTPLTLELVNTALSALIVEGVRAGRPLMPQATEVTAFVFSAFGMPRWAAHVREAAAGGAATRP